LSEQRFAVLLQRAHQLQAGAGLHDVRKSRLALA